LHAARYLKFLYLKLFIGLNDENQEKVQDMERNYKKQCTPGYGIIRPTFSNGDNAGYFRVMT